MSDLCLHCGQKCPDHQDFCCNGCSAAYELINTAGLSSYYQKRLDDISNNVLKPDENPRDIHIGAFVQTENNINSLYLMVEGVHCAACIWLIETLLNRQEGVMNARVNMSTKRLTLKWEGDIKRGQELVAMIESIGYRLVPFDPKILRNENEEYLKFLLVCLGIAGFAAGNIMLISISLWFDGFGMGEATRNILHWLSSLIALPVIIFSGRPFFYSAFSALKNRRSNMDVPISLAIILTSIISLIQTMNKAHDVYFDSAIMLLFFLLIGRYLDTKARYKATNASQDLLLLTAGSATVINEDGSQSVIPSQNITLGMNLLVCAGEKIPADGVILEGNSEIDMSLINGETIPHIGQKGSDVFAGTINLSAPITLKVTKVGQGTLLNQIVSMMENAEKGQAKYVRIADRIAGYYTPVVHSLAALTFIYWLFVGGEDWQQSLMTAVTVLIITCPCALALAVPVVQVVASRRLMQQGILLKSGEALEKIPTIDSIIFDKTGTLTLGHPELVNKADISLEILQLAASIAKKSKHPLSRALAKSYHGEPIKLEVTEIAGKGLLAKHKGEEIRLGNRDFCKVQGKSQSLEFWLSYKNQDTHFIFKDQIRQDAKEIISDLKSRAIHVILLSGDAEAPVTEVAEYLDIDIFEHSMTPDKKYAYIEAMRDVGGKKIMMVGDGLNDAPSLALADVSVSPSTAMDISQNAADIIFQGEKLYPIKELFNLSTKTQKLVRQNFAIALCYNLLAIPLAMMGYVTPLLAALAMSSSSIIVITNALRLSKK